MVRLSQPGFSQWAVEKIADGYGSVKYDYWYHTHPFEAGFVTDINHIVPGLSYVKDPNQPSRSADPDSDSDISYQTKLLGIIVSPTNIVVFRGGDIICKFDRQF